jgi:hypothetical protein
MPADVSGAVDMEKVKPGPNPTPYWDAHSFLAVRRHRFPANLPFPSSHDALN